MPPLMVAILAAQAAKGILNTISTIQQTQGEIKQLKRQAAWELRMSGYSYQQGVFAAGMRQLESAKQVGTMRTQMAVSGVDAAPEVIAESTFLAELERQNIIVAAAREALGHREQAREYAKRAHALKSNLPFQVIAGLIGGGAGMAQTYGGYQQGGGATALG